MVVSKKSFSYKNSQHGISKKSSNLGNHWGDGDRIQFLRIYLSYARPSALICLFLFFRYQKQAYFILKKNVAQWQRRLRSDKYLSKLAASFEVWVKSTFVVFASGLCQQAFCNVTIYIFLLFIYFFSEKIQPVLFMTMLTFSLNTV